MKKLLSLLVAIAILNTACENGEGPIKVIEFEDNLVKTICTIYWDKDNDGELSYAEAESVTFIDDVFSNSHIKSFTELQYFTNLETISKTAFEYCENLTAIIIPDSVTSIGEHAFYRCTSLTSINIPDGVTEIGRGTFFGCENLKEIIIPDSVITIGESAFENCKGVESITIGKKVTLIEKKGFGTYSDYLKTIYCKPATPPTVGAGGITTGCLDVPIYVPRASVSAYKSASFWSYWSSNIVGYDF